MNTSNFLTQVEIFSTCKKCQKIIFLPYKEEGRTCNRCKPFPF